MRIQNLSSENKGGLARTAATVVWEDCDRPTREIYFETPEEFARDLTLNPHAFLVGSIMPAMHHGEKRIAVEGEICPELRNGLMTAMGWMRHWYGGPEQPMRIEAPLRTRLPLPRTPERAGSFLSGGVDSLAMLRANRLDFPLEHPRSIRDCILVYGFDIGAISGGDNEKEVFALARQAAAAIAEDAGVTLIPVYTNIRHLDADVESWIYQYDGAALASVSHALANRLTRVSIASGEDIPNIGPHGSHPLIDPCYSSADLQIQHSGIQLTRFEKVQLIADWAPALTNLRVCTDNPPGRLNCGHCEKCIRTMTELLAAGKLAECSTFPVKDVSASLLETVTFNFPFEEAFFVELIKPLTEIGRVDLVQVIRSKAAQYRKRVVWEQERDWKGAIKRVDRRYLRSGLFRLYKAARLRIKARHESGPVA